jgi:hypothetical protein
MQETILKIGRQYPSHPEYAPVKEIGDLFCFVLCSIGDLFCFVLCSPFWFQTDRICTSNPYFFGCDSVRGLLFLADSSFSECFIFAPTLFFCMDLIRKKRKAISLPTKKQGLGKVVSHEYKGVL